MTDGDGAGELDSAFRDAVLQPWRASPRPTPSATPPATPPAAPAASPTLGAEVSRLRDELAELQEEVATLHDELDERRATAERDRDGWAIERRALQGRIDELESRQRSAAPSPDLAELARGIVGLTDRMRVLAARPAPRP